MSLPPRELKFGDGALMTGGFFQVVAFGFEPVPVVGSGFGAGPGFVGFACRRRSAARVRGP